MSTNGKAYDLVPENFSTIQSILGQEQNRLVREEGIRSGTARYRAAELMCETLIKQPTKASELLSWIAIQLAASRKHVEQNVVQASFVRNGNGSLPPMKILDAENDPDFSSGQKHTGQSQEISEQLRHLEIGKIAEIGPFASQIEARRTQTNMDGVIKRDLKWHRLEGDKPPYKSITKQGIDGWYLKVNRIA
jgi:hypothetical protein